MKHRLILHASITLVACGLCAPSASAGGQLPPVQLEGFGNTKAKSFDDFAGRTVLIELFEFWGTLGADAVPHLNALHEKYAEKGLSILGLTQASKSLTEPWIAANHPKYAYAYDRGGLQSKLGVAGIPFAVLVDPLGKIVWEGMPGDLPDKVIEEALRGSLAKPLFELPPAANGIRVALQKHSYAAALAEAGKLTDAEGGADLKHMVQAVVAGRVELLQTALKDGDFLTAQELAVVSKKELEGLPEASEADKALAQIKADKDAERVIGAQKRIRALEDQKLGKRTELDKAIADLEKIAKEFQGTFAAKEATEYMAQLEKRKAAPAK
jgi:hypothetical protein